MSMTESMKSSERLERCRRFGFDCVDGLEFGRGWVAGGDYKMRLSLQNVGKKMQTIKYKLPTTKFFSMEFPTVVKVSPGMTYNVDVVFRPIVLDEYDDCVEFTTIFGVFSIPVKATLLKKCATPYPHTPSVRPAHAWGRGRTWGDVYVGEQVLRRAGAVRVRLLPDDGDQRWYLPRCQRRRATYQLRLANRGAFLR
jgi:hypothetical protein